MKELKEISKSMAQTLDTIEVYCDQKMQQALAKLPAKESVTILNTLGPIRESLKELRGEFK